VRNFEVGNTLASVSAVDNVLCDWELNSGAEALAFRSAMRKFVGGVTVVTTLHEERPWGMTVSAFSPACMDPPTLIACVNRETVTASNITRDKRFAVNVLSQDQVSISQFCSRSGEDKFVEDFVVPADRIPERVKMPVLSNSLITFDCSVNGMLVVNSHLVILAAVHSILAPADKHPLLYGQGQYMHGTALETAGAS
jgi:flavin reductase (DIM6/NTAB) family NADH-FMN oxidoreductase RutF